jgi:hypothetical protein
MIIDDHQQSVLIFQDRKTKIIQKFQTIIIVQEGAQYLPKDLNFDLEQTLLIVIPNSITSIDAGCFSECSSLTNITLPDSIKSIGDYCFYKCSSLPNITLPDSIKSIGVKCFSECSSFTNITLPNSITSIGYNCFSIYSHYLISYFLIQSHQLVIIVYLNVYH